MLDGNDKLQALTTPPVGGESDSHPTSNFNYSLPHPKPNFSSPSLSSHTIDMNSTSKLIIRTIEDPLCETEKHIVECLKIDPRISKAWRLFRERYERKPSLPSFRRWANRDRVKREMLKFYEESKVIGKWSEGRWVSELDGIIEGEKESNMVQLGAIKLMGDYKGYLKKGEKEMPSNVRIEILQANGEK